MTFLEHLEELRWHIIRSVIAIIVFAVLAFIFKKIIFDVVLIAPKTPDFITNRILCHLSQVLHMESLCINVKPFQLVSTSMAGQFSTHIWISIIAGIIVASPVVFYEFWSFVAPALYTKERSHARGAVFIISFLFILGVLFGYYLIVPLSVHFLGSYSVSDQVENMINLWSYFSVIASVSLASGIVFELPVIVYFLSKIGLLTPAFMRKYRKHSVIIILTLAAIITPPDVFSQMLVSVPLYLLYEVSILISARVTKKRDAEQRQTSE